MGGSVWACEKGRPIIFADRVVKEEQNEKGEVSVRVLSFPKDYTVFNWCQMKGLPEKVPVERDNQQIVSAEELLRR